MFYSVSVLVERADKLMFKWPFYFRFAMKKLVLEQVLKNRFSNVFENVQL